MSNVKLNWKFDKETKALSADGPGGGGHKGAAGFICDKLPWES